MEDRGFDIAMILEPYRVPTEGSSSDRLWYASKNGKAAIHFSGSGRTLRARVLFRGDGFVMAGWRRVADVGVRVTHTPDNGF